MIVAGSVVISFEKIKLGIKGVEVAAFGYLLFAKSNTPPLEQKARLRK